MDGLRDQFLAEGRELVESAAADLLALSTDPGRIDSAFRAVHTLKGSAGLFDLKPLGALLHAAEDLLGALRAGTLAADTALVGLLLQAIDQTAAWIDAFDSTERLPEDAPRVAQQLGAALRRPLPDSVAAPAPAAAPSTAPDQPWILALLARLEPDNTDPVLHAIRYVPRQDCFFSGDDPIGLFRVIPALRHVAIAERAPWGPAESYDPFACNLVLDGLSAAPLDQIRAVLRGVPDQVQIVAVERRTAGRESVPEAVSSRTLRVDAERIDALAGLADEIIVANNALAHLAAQARRGVSGETLVKGILASQAGLDQLAGQLHRAVMRIRLIPLAALFRSFPRLVREIGAQLDKELELLLQGETIEVDKALVDGLFEPILHLIRNAADHGIESAVSRRAAGKPACAAITLSARRMLDAVVIEITDDGQGIDPDSVRRTAVQRGVLSEDAAAALSAEQAIELVFAAGFSTAASVTDLSGRGVGLDAVRSAVTRLGGRVALTSRPGQGTSVRLTLPASVVLTGIVIIGCGGDLYGVPIDAVIETLRLPPDRVVPIRSGRAFAWRDQAVPIFDLATLLGQAAAPPEGDLKLLLFRQGETVSAVAVDGFSDRQSLLLRPMDGLLSAMKGLAGTALLGTGQVLIVLDLAELAT